MSSAPPIFLPGFKRHLQSVKPFLRRDVADPLGRLGERLRGKQGAALEAELQAIFRVISEPKEDGHFSKESLRQATGKLEEFIKCVVEFDTKSKEEFNRIANEGNPTSIAKTRQYLNILKSDQFIKLCARGIEGEIQRQKGGIAQRAEKQITSIVEAKAGQDAVSDWGQVGAQIYAMMTQVIQNWEAEQGVDVLSQLPAESDSHKAPYLTMKG